MVQKKTTSYDRAIKIWSNVSSADMNLYNASIQQKDYNTANNILKALNITQSNLQKQTLEAYSRLSYQYTNAIYNPNQKVQQYIKKTYAFELEKGNYAENLNKMGNSKNSQLQQQPTLVSGSNVIALSGNLRQNKIGHFETSIKKQNELLFLNEISALDTYKSVVNRDLGITMFKVFLKCKTDIKTEFIISTKWESIGNFAQLRKLLKNINRYINSSSNYYDYHGESAIVDTIEEYIIEYR